MDITTSINPANGKEIGQYKRISVQEATTFINQAHECFLNWKQTTFQERAFLLNQLAEVLETDLEKYAQMATQEMGKTIGQARKEIEKCALVCRYYADNGAHLLQNENVATEAKKSYVTFQPMGVVLAIMPWNFPFYQVIRFAAPALMAGNVAVLKHASNVQGCAFLIQEAFEKAGFPKATFTNLNVDSSAIETLIEQDKIVAVTLTGSEKAGRSVASVAGKNLKKAVLELGGSDAYVILGDADLEKATDLAVFGRLQNNGQTCIAAKRFVVVEPIYNDFIAMLTQKMAAAKMGNPLEETTFYGPLARIDLRDELHDQVEKSVKEGARLLLGGVIPQQDGAYYPATILADVNPGMVAFDQELFGPVAAICKAENEKHAIELANKSEFGLGSGVFTSDVAKGEQLALQLEAGSSFVNKLVVSDPRLPFGGIKNSGFGRELSGYGIKEFVNIKTIWVE
ncbi:NAD-dependent succinate-semialdehyde dehydrogenase [Flavobacterium agrisoli]|uniref:NAD-dependent succinate-semialdehyde dehydrogenase n=1 Tax=Flavobacterium agrisoli TaxID=2793066 RepID=A0A934UKG8_9FLAO|nr:NAD-dependent succinate-semialdehyde dehydrogenase [Flavobacterium agrisoli]MBK0370425.1 NAD-dependent succinate-semialdehyde dehydrogenase [Flavobacterium agrisoli]